METKVLTKEEIQSSLKGIAKVDIVDLASLANVEEIHEVKPQNGVKPRRKRCEFCTELVQATAYGLHTRSCGANPRRVENRKILCENCGVRYAPQAIDKHTPGCDGNTFQSSLDAIIYEYRKIGRARAKKAGVIWRPVNKTSGLGKYPYMTLLKSGKLDAICNRLIKGQVIPANWRGQDFESMTLPDIEDAVIVPEPEIQIVPPQLKMAELTVDGDFEAFVSIMEDHISNSNVTFREFEAWRHVTKVIWEKA